MYRILILHFVYEFNSKDMKQFTEQQSKFKKKYKMEKFVAYLKVRQKD